MNEAYECEYMDRNDELRQVGSTANSKQQLFFQSSIKIYVMVVFDHTLGAVPILWTNILLCFLMHSIEALWHDLANVIKQAPKANSEFEIKPTSLVSNG